MSKVALIVDSTGDLPLSYLKDNNVCMVPLKVSFGQDTYFDAIEMTPSEFYKRLAVSEELPKTSMPSPQQFKDCFEKLADEGYEEAVSLSISSGISGTYNGSVLAAQDAPIKVHTVDTKCVTLGLGLIADAAVKLRDAGFSAEEIATKVEEIAKATELHFIIGSMDNLVKGGRAHKAAGLASSLLDIKPILTLDEEGKIVPFKRFKGQAKALSGLASYVKKQNDLLGPLNYTLIYTDDISDIDDLRNALAKKGIEGSEILCGSNGPVIGTYVPDACGIAFYPQSVLD